MKYMHIHLSDEPLPKENGIWILKKKELYIIRDPTCLAINKFLWIPIV